MPKLKKKTNKMGDYVPSDKEREAYVWGIRNGYRIAPRAVSNNSDNKEWYVEIHSGGRFHHSGDKFGPVEVWEQVYKYYQYYYDKRIKV